MELKFLKDIIESSNMNFLLGSGLSRPYLITLGSIEQNLEKIDLSVELSPEQKNIAKACIFRKYFEEVMLKCSDIYKKSGTDVKDFNDVLTNYSDFLTLLNEIILKRYNTLLNKQINLFTTNIDLFIEHAVEKVKVEFNDGFTGRLNPVFSLSNFQKSFRKSSLHFKHESEIPVFNIFKLHGSINWRHLDDEIIHSNFTEIHAVAKSLEPISKSLLDDTTDYSAIEKFVIDNEKKLPIDKIDEFIDEYQKVQIINPSKEKFESTLLKTHYYELLRMFSNELEKENTLLLVMGFSFADEHIREITLRAANSNPTLKIVIFAYSDSSSSEISKLLKIDEANVINSNIEILTPESFLASNKDDSGIKEIKNFDFSTINSNVIENLKKYINPRI